MSRIIEQGGYIPSPVRTSSAFSIDKDKLIKGIYQISTFLTAPSSVATSSARSSMKSSIPWGSTGGSSSFSMKAAKIWSRGW